MTGATGATGGAGNCIEATADPQRLIDELIAETRNTDMADFLENRLMFIRQALDRALTFR